MDPQQSVLVHAFLFDLSQASAAWYDIILPYSRNIFYTLVGFQLIWMCITFALGKRQGDEFISTLFVMVIDVGFFYALILHPDWIFSVINSFRHIGRDAGRLERLSPDAVLDTGLDLAGAIISTIANHGFFEIIIAALVGVFMALAVLASFAFIAARMVLVIAEIFFIVNIGPVLLAFSGLSATKYIATQYLGYVLSSGVQLLVMYLLIGAGLDMAATWADMITDQGAQDISAFMLVGLASVLYAIVAWNLPKVIGGLAAGAPQMSHGSLFAPSPAVSAGRGFARASVNTAQSAVNTYRAASANCSTRLEGVTKSSTKAVLKTAYTAGVAVAASGVNTLLGRHGRRSSAERIAESTARLKAARSQQSTQQDTAGNNSGQNAQNNSASSSTTTGSMA